MTKTLIAVVGNGKIARDEHIPAILASERFALAGIVSPGESRADPLPVFPSLSELLDKIPELQAVAICTPPAVQAGIALEALSAGKHVLMEKPPTNSISELEALQELANDKGQVLFQAWHSQHSEAVVQAKALLSEHGVVSFRIDWREDVRRWHPGQDWVWEPGGFGVCDPGINALSILTKVMPFPVFISRSRLVYPANRQGPIRVDLELTPGIGASDLMVCAFDWLAEGEQVWSLRFRTRDGREVVLENGGRRLLHGATLIHEDNRSEYRAVYARFADLLEKGESEVDAAPFRLMSDIFFKGSVEFGPEFHW